MFDRISIRYKLIVLLGLSAGIALIISSLIAIYSTYLSESKSSLRVLHQLTGVISENMRAALAFNDADSANNMLASLHADPHILLAVVSDESGKQLGEYRSERLLAGNEQAFKQALHAHIRENASVLRSADGFVQRIDHDSMGVLRPIFFENKLIGTLAIISDTELMWAKIREFVLVQIAASVLTLVLLLFLSFKLQALFTRPITSLISTMQEVAQTKNYRAMLASSRRDEFKSLYEVFNAMLSDIHERDVRLSKLATTDALTGLANRHHAMEIMQTMVIRAQRKGEPIGIIMLDLDFFKRVNDLYGHPVGDLVLQVAAQVLLDSAREYDLVARLGGEEFLVICDCGTLDACIAVAERIRLGLEGQRIEYQPGCSLNVTVSLGVYSSEKRPGEPIETMIAAADEALYRAKAAGRNRYIVA